MNGNPSAKCISSPTGDVESDAEGDNDTISHHMNSDPGIPHRAIPSRASEKRVNSNPGNWRSVLRSEEARTYILDPKASPFVPKCSPVDKPTSDGFNLVELDRQHTTLDDWGWWQNYLRLSGALHDGQSMSLTEPELDPILRRGINRIKYSPSPGQRRLAKKQARATKWRTNQWHKELYNATRQSMRQIRKLTEPSLPNTIDKYMEKLKPTTKELEARTTKNWKLLKRGSKKYSIKKSAREYVAKTARQQAQMDRLIADWSKGGYGSIDLKKPEGVI